MNNYIDDRKILADLAMTGSAEHIEQLLLLASLAVQEGKPIPRAYEAFFIHRLTQILGQQNGSSLLAKVLIKRKAIRPQKDVDHDFQWAACNELLRRAKVKEAERVAEIAAATGKEESAVRKMLREYKAARDLTNVHAELLRNSIPIKSKLGKKVKDLSSYLVTG